jgi:hypothetical protein
MENRVGGLSGSREPSPSVSALTGFDPGRGELEKMVDELLDPLRGVERGLLSEDADTMLINIRVGELRKVARCLRLTARVLLNEEIERAA